MPVPAMTTSEAAARPGKRKRKLLNDAHYHLAPIHPHGIRPSGNSLFSSHSIRESSLGSLSVLLDEILLSILSLLEPVHLSCLQSVSHACRAFALYEPQWKEATIAKTGGHLKVWSGSWRNTYKEHFYPSSSRILEALPPIRAKGLFSDALFLPLQLASTPLERYIPPKLSSKRSARPLDRLRETTSNSGDFEKQYLSAGKPCLIVEDQSQQFLPSWTIKDLSSPVLYGSKRIRAEALTMPMSCYAEYANSCQGESTEWISDESPFYLFDPILARTLQRQGRFIVPSLLRDECSTNQGIMRRDWDLFSLLQEQRPDHAWVIAGPIRSGSGWHVDPNSTSAFNTVLSGQKLWMLLPPEVTPPGVYISKDGSSVTAPLSIIEWLVNFWDETIRLHGRHGDDTLFIDVCSSRETIFVPAGWRHLVINLDESVAFTQNFAGSAELAKVLDMFKNCPEQISGFRLGKTKTVKESDTKRGEDESDIELDELNDGGIREKRALFQLFLDRLQQFDPQLAEKGLQDMKILEQQRSQLPVKSTMTTIAREKREGATSSLWNSLKSKSDMNEGGFTFDLGEDEV